MLRKPVSESSQVLQVWDMLESGSNGIKILCLQVELEINSNRMWDVETNSNRRRLCWGTFIGAIDSHI